MHQIRFRLGLHCVWGSSQRSPRTPSWILGVLLLRGGRRGKGWRGKGKGRKGRARPSPQTWIHPWAAAHFSFCASKKFRPAGAPGRDETEEEEEEEERKKEIVVVTVVSPTYVTLACTINLTFYRASAHLAMQSPVLAIVGLSVCSSVCLSHAGTASKRRKLGPENFHRFTDL